MVIVLTAPPTPFPSWTCNSRPLNLAAQNDHSPVAWLLCVSLINEYDLYGITVTAVLFAISPILSVRCR